MTGPDQPAPTDGDQIKHRVVARLDAAHMDAGVACASAGCSPENLVGGGDLTFEEAVGLAGVLGCSPAVFYEPLDTPSDTPGGSDGPGGWVRS